MVIASASNPFYKHIKSLKEKKYRKKYREYIVEGFKSVHDAVNSPKKVKNIILSESYIPQCDFPANIEITVLSQLLFEKLSDTETPQGIMAVIETDAENNFIPDKSKAYIYCDRINDPGNLGTVIRTADAAGFGAVILSHGCADLYSPKTVRASMGSFFNINVIADKDIEFLKSCRRDGFALYCGALGDGARDYRKTDMTRPTIIIVGNEANGVSSEIQKISECVKIPILGKAESLNVSVAAAILMYELISQRS